MNSYKDLEVWKKSIHLSKYIYSITKSFPKNEQFGLVSQMRRSSVSIISNVAEGFGRHNVGDNISFLSYSLGSAFELECQIFIANTLSFISESESVPLCKQMQSVIRLLYKYKQSQIRYKQNNPA